MEGAHRPLRGQDQDSHRRLGSVRGARQRPQYDVGVQGPPLRLRSDRGPDSVAVGLREGVRQAVLKGPPTFIRLPKAWQPEAWSHFKDPVCRLVKALFTKELQPAQFNHALDLIRIGCKAIAPPPKSPIQDRPNLEMLRRAAVSISARQNRWRNNAGSLAT